MENEGDLTAKALQEGLRRLCRGTSARKRELIELSELAQTGQSGVTDMSRQEVLARVGERVRFEGMPCRIREKGSIGPWQRGVCRRYGTKTLVFVPLDDQGDTLTLTISEVEIINDFDWARQQTDAQLIRTEQQIGRLRTNLKKLDSAYRRVLSSRGGEEVVIAPIPPKK